MNNRNPNIDSESKKMARYLFWLMLLQGLSFILMGFLVLIYPLSLFLLVATTLFWLGFTTILIGFRWRSLFKKELPRNHSAEKPIQP